MSHISCVRALTLSQIPTKREYILEIRGKEQERKRGINFAPSGRGQANTTEYDFFLEKSKQKIEFINLFTCETEFSRKEPSSTLQSNSE